MAGIDELSDDELKYLESGGKSDAPVEPSPASETKETPTSVQDAPAADQNAKQDGGDKGDDGDEGEEVVEVVNGKARGRDGKFVSHKALHSEREKHKLTKSENQQLRERLARGEERLAILNEAFNGNAAPAANGQQKPSDNPWDQETIDPEKDLFAAFRQQQARHDWDRKQWSSAQQTTQHKEAMTSLQQTYVADAQRFLAEKPDFRDAYTHLVTGRHKELQALGVTDEGQRRQIIEAEESAVVAQALKNRQSPSLVLYTMAQSRGFTPKPNGAANGNGNPAPNAAQEKIRQLQNGQRAAETLSNAGGKANSQLTYDELVGMTDAEFDAAVSGMSKQQVERLMGR